MPARGKPRISTGCDKVPVIANIRADFVSWGWQVNDKYLQTFLPIPWRCRWLVRRFDGFAFNQTRTVRWSINERKKWELPQVFTETPVNPSISSEQRIPSSTVCWFVTLTEAAQMKNGQARFRCVPGTVDPIWRIFRCKTLDWNLVCGRIFCTNTSNYMVYVFVMLLFLQELRLCRQTGEL